MADSSFVSDSFLWEQENGITRLRSIQALLLAAGVTQVQGWQLTSATGISDDGHVICGYGTNPNGKDPGWVATLP